MAVSVASHPGREPDARFDVSYIDAGALACVPESCGIGIEGRGQRAGDHVEHIGALVGQVGFANADFAGAEEPLEGRLQRLAPFR
jgi:hypothetical protein